MHILVSTIASNTATGSSFDFGGGIYNDGSLKLDRITIAGNQADYGGGLHGNANLYGSIIGANSATDSGADVAGTINSYDYNLIQSAPGLNIIGATDHNIIGQDPMLAPLANNGGFGETMALRPGSPAIDKGKNFDDRYDQRTVERPFDFASVPNAGDGEGCDIGAFELSQPVLSISREQSNVVLRWPAIYGDFILESSPAVPGANVWTPVVPAPVVGPSGQFYVTNSLAMGNRYFRLKNR